MAGDNSQVAGKEVAIVGWTRSHQPQSPTSFPSDLCCGPGSWVWGTYGESDLGTAGGSGNLWVATGVFGLHFGL